jgi:exosortase
VRMNRFNRNFILLCTVSGLSFLVYIPVFLYLVMEWEYNPFYSHGFMVIVLSVFLILLISRKYIPVFLLSDEMEWAGVYCCAIIIFIGSGIFGSFFIQSISFICVVYALLMLSFGTRNSLAFLFPVVFLIFMIPLPGLEYMATLLSALSAQAASFILNQAGYATTCIGAELELSHLNIVIGAPCSGLRTIISLLVPATLLLFLLDRSIFSKFIYFLMIFPLAILSNLLRIIQIAFIASVYGEAAAIEFIHAASGLFMPVLTFLLLILIIAGTGGMSFRKDLLERG